MMKKLQYVITVILLLGLISCGGQGKTQPAPFDPTAGSQALLPSGAFSEELEAIDRTVACALYGIDPETVKECAVYGSTGTTAEELAIFVLTDEAAAQAALKQLTYRVEDRTADMTSYLPREVPKLEKAVLEQRGCTVILIIAADYGPVDAFLKG